MKYIITVIVVFSISLNASAQVAFGKTVLASTSASIDFGPGNRGMVLPWVTSTGAVAGAVNGTMVYDLSDKKVKVKYNTEWKDLSINSGSTVDPLTSTDGVLIQNSATENDSARSSIGATTSSVPGILVLEDNNKAMILPKVASPHLNIINPSPGMIVYDTLNKQLAVFNGTQWSFWRN